MATRIQDSFVCDGWGFWAVERKEDARFIGFVGLRAQPSSLPFSPCVEIGWRLASDTWGHGYATEAAHRCLHFGFEDLNLTEIVSFTASSNLRSQRVMQRLGMHRDVEGDFLHPLLPPEHSLAPHVLYRLNFREYLENLVCPNKSG